MMSSMSTHSFGFRTSPRISSARPPSVYGGAGGNNVRISNFGGMKTAFDLADALGGGSVGFSEVGLALNEKGTMQNLNKRLASYLEKVRSLESANNQLERQIHEWYEKKVPLSRDYSQHEKTITELRRKVRDAILENARIILEIDNGKLAVEDFRIKMETELDMRQSLEADITRLRKALDDITITRSDLEMKIEQLKEELILMKKDHVENVASLRAEMNGSTVNVQVDAIPQPDLSEVMVKIREQYEAIILKNRQEMETWYKGKYEELNKQVSQHTELIQTSRSEASDLKRTLETWEIELQSEHSRKRVLENTLCETESRYCQQFGKLQTEVHKLEEELASMRMKIEHQDGDFRSLLNIKTRLEMEIAEYRRLLEGEDIQYKVVEVEKPESIKTKKVTTVVEEMVDGKVVSHTENVDVQVVNWERDEGAEAAQALQDQAGRYNVVLVSTTQENGRKMERSQLLSRIRTQYGHLPASNHSGPSVVSPANEPERLHTQPQEGTPQAQVRRNQEALWEARAELTQARRQWHGLQVEIESLHALEKGLERSLQDTQEQYKSQLQDLSRVIQGLEAELDQVRSSIESQRQLHYQLLNTRVRLEHEITTYRQLLEREERRIHGRNDRTMNLNPEPGHKEVHTSKNNVRRTPGVLQRQKSLIIFTENTERKMATVKTQEILHGNVVQESAEAHGTVETKKIDVIIKQWEGSFFRGNPKLRKKSVSLRFDLHMAAADEGCGQTQLDELPDVEVRLVMKRSRSIPTITP